ncbi:MAG: hypothetical protein KC582_03135 [Candidatus Magasanikbacteria bacterium]|nr:hypothetical protein [Candidatus Magasanikbacteria bacterium]MCA9389545.1 hypothetical protein [Candidatus Magasanikbacteria bacterium]MCA9391223.1 hypothetical protein [Candidatus Magasanikbacteria bacterium]USN52469.1 MAG: hypothetical protein H6759_00040 [Candidatus Nomurabacteria bacterium]
MLKRYQRRADALHAKAKREISLLRHPLILTGSGVSIPSGLSHFQGPIGFWDQCDCGDISRKEFVHANTKSIFEYFERERFAMRYAKPNSIHYAIASYLSRVKQDGGNPYLITQNVDGLHTKAGSETIEVFGCIHRWRCLSCNHSLPAQLNIKSCPMCRGGLKHDIALFEDDILVYPAITHAITHCDGLILIGANSNTLDTHGLVEMVRNSGKVAIELNPIIKPSTAHILTVAIEQSLEEIIPLIFS